MGVEHPDYLYRVEYDFLRIQKSVSVVAKTETGDRKSRSGNLRTKFEYARRSTYKHFRDGIHAYYAKNFPSSQKKKKKDGGANSGESRKRIGARENVRTRA